MLGSTAAGTATAIGLTIANLNGGLEVSGGVLVACNLFELIPTCPP